MKTEATKLLKTPKTLMILAAVGAVVLVVVLVPTLIYPRYISWRNLQQLNKQDTLKLNNLNDNVLTLAKIDKDKISEYKELLNDLLPEAEDSLRSVSILDQISKNSGMSLESVQVTASDKAKVTKKVTTTSAGSTQPTTGSQNTLGVTQQASSSTHSKTSEAKASAGYTIVLTLHGDFSSTLSLINTLGLVKRTLNITSITMSKAAGTERATINLTLGFPSSQKATVSPEEKVELTASEEKILEELLKILVINASPSTLPLGKSDPFSP